MSAIQLEIIMASYHFSVKTGKRGSATNHAAYIAREGKHGKDDKINDLVAVQHGNLPDWANGDPKAFWRAADENERVNGAAYREFEVALPSELTKEQNIALVQEFIKKEVGNKPVHFAIHAPTAALGGVEQLHAHIMTSDRVPDGISRSPEQHFKRHNRDKPELGGCRKDSGGKDKGVLKAELVSRRKCWADLENDHLTKHGFTAQVDHRSNRARGIEAKPERHLGQACILKMSEDEKTNFQAERKLKKVVLVRDKPIIEKLEPAQPGASANPT